MIGVYRLINTKTGEFYIGSSRDLQQRKSKHFYELKTKTSKNIDLKIACDVYGNECFEFEILEECSREDLKDLEYHYIQLLRPHYNRVTPTAPKKIKRITIEAPRIFIKQLEKWASFRNCTIKRYVTGALAEQFRKEQTRIEEIKENIEKRKSYLNEEQYEQS